MGHFIHYGLITTSVTLFSEHLPPPLEVPFRARGLSRALSYGAAYMHSVVCNTYHNMESEGTRDMNGINGSSHFSCSSKNNKTLKWPNPNYYNIKSTSYLVYIVK